MDEYFKNNFDDFSEIEYREIVGIARHKWKFLYFSDFSIDEEWTCLWRHDIDCSVQRAVHIASIEADLGVRATYFVLLHSEFYNLLEYEITQAVYKILEMGHKIGLHFDPSFYGKKVIQEKLISSMQFEKNILEKIFTTNVDVFSWHNPDQQGLGDIQFIDEFAGMVNTYGRQIGQKYSYISDSNGYWRYRRLPDLVREGKEPRLHVLTHPEWWTPIAISPRERIMRCINGRAVKQLKNYDQLLKKAGRINIF